MKFLWGNMENGANSGATDWKFGGWGIARLMCWYKIIWVGTDMPNNLKISTEYSRNMIANVKYNIFFIQEA